MNIDELHALKGIDRLLGEIELRKEIKTSHEKLAKVNKRECHADWMRKRRWKKKLSKSS